nr:MAG TPA: hypothetical protein [Caudoviricetes sp.]
MKPVIALCYIYVSIPEVIKACLYYKCYINVKGFYPSFFLARSYKIRLTY